MDLTTQKRGRRLSHRYEGRGIGAGSLLYRPMKITQFEIVPSQLHPGKDCLAAQVYTIDRQTGEITANLMWAEGYRLIETIRGTEARLPHLTKITRDRDGYLLFAPLNDKEKETLSNI